PASRPLGRRADPAGIVDRRVPPAVRDQPGVRPAVVARCRADRRVGRARRAQQPRLDRSRRGARRRRALDRQAAHRRLPRAPAGRRRALTSLLPTLELETGRPSTASVIWLHGLGADGHDFEPIVPELDLPDALAVRFVFPHAPTPPVTINGGAVMPAGYAVYALEGARADVAQAPRERGLPRRVARVPDGAFGVRGRDRRRLGVAPARAERLIALAPGLDDQALHRPPDRAAHVVQARVGQPDAAVLVE